MRERLKILLGYPGLLIPHKWLVSACRQNIIFPFYHAVSDHPMPHVSHTFPVRSVRRFKKDLDFLLKHYEPVGLDEVLEKGRKRNKPAMLLSFDDGLTEMKDIIAPILLSRGIPAAIFVNTDFIDNRDLFYRYRSSLILDRLESIRYSPSVTEVMQRRYHLASPTKRCVKEFLLNMSYKNRQELSEVALLLDLDFKAFLKVKKPYLSSLELQELSAQGFYIGSHSKDHPRFSEIQAEDRLNQYRGSMEFLQHKFNIDYGIFSFPFSDDGVPEDFFRDIRKEGMPRIDASFGSRGLKKDPVSFHHQRIPMEKLKAPGKILIRGEFLYYLLKGVIGKNDVKRK